MSLLTAFVVLLFLYSLVSRRLEDTVVTAPIVFTVAGMLIAFLLPAAAKPGIDADVFLHLAELGLALVLFTDASRTDLRVLRRIRSLPIRLLSVGMLLTIALGTLAAQLVFPHLSVWEAGILAAILAPTDAGLGQIIVNSPRVPLRIRQALNVEAGLNDGLAVPFLLFFIALAAAGADGGNARLTHFMIEQLGIGTLVGVVIGLCGGWLLALARRKGWLAPSFQQIAVLALPLMCILASEMLGASMFIAAFVAGLAVQVCFEDVGHHSLEFAEEWGQVLSLSVFFLLGLLVARHWGQFDGAFLLYAALSLTLVRMLPVGIALLGARLSGPTVLFMGWFGPRGLASIVLGLVYLQHETRTAGAPDIQLAVMMTVLISIFAHGLTAMPGIALYSRKVALLDSTAPENEKVAE
jgi:NhaP-type Na+/H+ or K+/H+ antiporter